MSITQNVTKNMNLPADEPSPPPSPGPIVRSPPMEDIRINRPQN